MNKVLNDYIESKTKLIKDINLLTSNFYKNIKLMSENDKKECISYLYFETDISSNVIKNIFHIKAELNKYCNIYTKEIQCFYCGNREKVLIKSRTDLKQKQTKYMCSICKEKNKKEEDIKIKESELYWENNAKEQKEELKKLKSMPYKEYLETEHWKNFRKKIIKYANYRCQMCNKKGILNVHHRNYECKGEESYKDVVVLCQECHAKFHGKS